jgi:hypothetical protein
VNYLNNTRELTMFSACIQAVSGQIKVDSNGCTLKLQIAILFAAPIKTVDRPVAAKC